LLDILYQLVSFLKDGVVYLGDWLITCARSLFVIGQRRGFIGTTPLGLVVVLGRVTSTAASLQANLRVDLIQINVLRVIVWVLLVRISSSVLGPMIASNLGMV